MESMEENTVGNIDEEVACNEPYIKIKCGKNGQYELVWDILIISMKIRYIIAYYMLSYLGLS